MPDEALKTISSAFKSSAKISTIQKKTIIKNIADDNNDINDNIAIISNETNNVKKRKIDLVTSEDSSDDTIKISEAKNEITCFISGIRHDLDCLSDQYHKELEKTVAGINDVINEIKDDVTMYGASLHQILEQITN